MEHLIHAKLTNVNKFGLIRPRELLGLVVERVDAVSTQPESVQELKSRLQKEYLEKQLDLQCLGTRLTRLQTTNHNKAANYLTSAKMNADAAAEELRARQRCENCGALRNERREQLLDKAASRQVELIEFVRKQKVLGAEMQSHDSNVREQQEAKRRNAGAIADENRRQHALKIRQLEDEINTERKMLDASWKQQEEYDKKRKEQEESRREAKELERAHKEKLANSQHEIQRLENAIAKIYKEYAELRAKKKTTE